MNIGIVGLGLIGGSFAKAFKDTSKIYAADINRSILDIAKIQGDVHEILTDEKLSEMDFVLICLYPKDAIKWLQDNSHKLKKQAVVLDCCGIKREICSVGFALAKKHGFSFVGGHPMAGKQFSGYKNSSAALLKDSYMILVPEDNNNIELLSKLEKILAPTGMKFTFTNPEIHDKIISFTSQLPHIISSAYVGSEHANMHKGYSAGSYKDLSRVAYLNVDMWTELFLSNNDFLVEEISGMSRRLDDFAKVIKARDESSLRNMLQFGREKKLEADRW